MVHSLNELLKANHLSRHDFLTKRGFNGSNEGGEEVTSQLFGYEVTDSLGNVSWVSEALFAQLSELFDNSSDAKETSAPVIDLTDLYNVYSEDRRDEINNKSKADKPKTIRVTGGDHTIPDSYIRIDVISESDIYILK